MTDEPRPTPKKVDESWKDEVDRERRAFEEAISSEGASPFKGASPVEPEAPGGSSAPSQPRGASGAVNFSVLVSSLSMQALVALGELPHPASNERQENLDEGRYLIDLLGVLKEKTQGNLTAQEEALLDNGLYELRMKYVAKRKPP